MSLKGITDKIDNVSIEVLHDTLQVENEELKRELAQLNAKIKAIQEAEEKKRKVDDLKNQSLKLKDEISRKKQRLEEITKPNKPLEVSVEKNAPKPFGQSGEGPDTTINVPVLQKPLSSINLDQEKKLSPFELGQLYATTHALPSRNRMENHGHSLKEKKEFYDGFAKKRAEILSTPDNPHKAKILARIRHSAQDLARLKRPRATMTVLIKKGYSEEEAREYLAAYDKQLAKEEAQEIVKQKKALAKECLSKTNQNSAACLPALSPATLTVASLGTMLANPGKIFIPSNMINANSTQNVKGENSVTKELIFSQVTSKGALQLGNTSENATESFAAKNGPS